MELVAVPPGVVTTILPLVAPAGTIAVICVSDFTVNVATTLLKVTLLACFRPVPVIVTVVPTTPLAGVKLEETGVTLKTAGVDNVAEPVVTVTLPVSAADGTVARMKVVPVRVLVVAIVPPNFTTEVDLKPWPRMPTWVVSLPL